MKPNSSSFPTIMSESPPALKALLQRLGRGPGIGAVIDVEYHRQPGGRAISNPRNAADARGSAAKTVPAVITAP